ncbi:MAG: ABC transporter substrate-binding protein [Candidatus Latescibacterota bacterium]|nr:ABC transporter substrate-binding protein [Candidatus Latescibacterota bacterium]
MRKLTLICFLVLAVSAVGTWLTEPDMNSEVPVLYWATDPNPARIQQVADFHDWLVENGHTTRDGKPRLELRLETDAADRKGIIQGVSGVSADIIQCDVRWYQSIGLLADMTEEANRLNFGIDQTYPALEPLLAVDGRQYGFPCNVNVMALWNNLETFEKIGMKPPPKTWDWDTFERIGKEFVEKANPPGQRQSVFFLNRFQHAYLVRTLHRSLGVSEFNETMTGSGLNRNGYAQTLARIYKWTYVDHIAASAAEESAFSTESGYSGAGLNLFQNGHYGLYTIGRWILIRLREFEKPPRVAVSHFPYAEFPNAVIGTRVAAVYKATRYPEEGALFLAYLASEKYNMGIVHSSDALPPGPRYTQLEAYTRPPEWPNEWGAHEIPAEGAETIAIATSISPYVPVATVVRYKEKALEEVMANLATPEAAAAEAARRIDAEIQLTLQESPSLRRRYEQESEIQAKIDRFLVEGRPIPIGWIRNPFHRVYYLAKGLVDTSRSQRPTDRVPG